MVEIVNMSGDRAERKRKKYQNLPVHVVEDHNEIVPFVHRAIGAGYLPFKGIAMVHLDSHPDMLISHDLLAQDTFDKDKLYSGTSIENWLIPLVYAGHIDRLAWVKPPWADQMAEGSRSVNVGRSKENDKIRVDSPESYFLGELLWSPEKDLMEKKKLHFNVKTVGTESSDISNGPQVKKLKTDDSTASEIVSTASSSPLLPNLEEDSLILDIDLDFFSTMNPFKMMYSEEQYSLMKKLYAFTAPASKDEEDLRKFVETREIQLGALKKAFEAVDSGAVPETSEFKGDLFHQLVDSIKSNPPENPLGKNVDWKWVHEAGTTYDDTELPHHVSDTSTIDKLMENVKKMLLQMPKPTIVTVSRSSADDYCPPDQVDGIQEQVIKLLRDIYGKLDVKFHYEED